MFVLIIIINGGHIIKVRRDFVTNSSSASFIISKDKIDLAQYFLIKNYREFYKILNKRYPKREFVFSDNWVITEDKKNIYGYAVIDNDDMKDLLKEIEIDINNIEYSDLSF